MVCVNRDGQAEKSRSPKNSVWMDRELSKPSIDLQIPGS